LQAGATMVVISLWDIDTASSLEIMTEFYKNLGQGLSVATSLKAARSKFRNLGKLPFDWAPFVLVGFHEFKK
jgi:CHAT domain-containing protein